VWRSSVNNFGTVAAEKNRHHRPAEGIKHFLVLNSCGDDVCERVWFRGRRLVGLRLFRRQLLRQPKSQICSSTHLGKVVSELDLDWRSDVLLMVKSPAIIRLRS